MFRSPIKNISQMPLSLLLPALFLLISVMCASMVVMSCRVRRPTVINASAITVTAGLWFWSAKGVTPAELFVVFLPLHLEVGILAATLWESRSIKQCCERYGLVNRQNQESQEACGVEP